MYGVGTVLHIRTTGSAKYIPLKAPSSNVIGPWYFKRQCKLENCDNVKAEINYTIASAQKIQFRDLCD